MSNTVSELDDVVARAKGLLAYVDSLSLEKKLWLSVAGFHHRVRRLEAAVNAFERAEASRLTVGAPHLHLVDTSDV
jgi:hypothetical protein